MKRLLTAAALFAAGAAAAFAGDERPALRLLGGAFLPTGDLSVSGLDVSVDNSFDNAPGLGVVCEWKLSPAWGIDAGLKYFDPDVKQERRGFGSYKTSVRFMPLSVGVNWHFTPGGKADWFVGPELAYVFYSQDVDDELVPGVKVGVSTPIARSWDFTASFEYLHAKGTVGGDDFKPRPFLVMVGAAYRF